MKINRSGDQISIKNNQKLNKQDNKLCQYEINIWFKIKDEIVENLIDEQLKEKIRKENDFKNKVREKYNEMNNVIENNSKPKKRKV